MDRFWRENPILPSPFCRAQQNCPSQSKRLTKTAQFQMGMDSTFQQTTNKQKRNESFFSSKVDIAYKSYRLSERRRMKKKGKRIQKLGNRIKSRLTHTQFDCDLIHWLAILLVGCLEAVPECRHRPCGEVGDLYIGFGCTWTRVCPGKGMANHIRPSVRVCVCELIQPNRNTFIFATSNPKPDQTKNDENIDQRDQARTLKAARKTKNTLKFEQIEWRRRRLFVFIYSFFIMWPTVQRAFFLLTLDVRGHFQLDWIHFLSKAKESQGLGRHSHSHHKCNSICMQSNTKL